jgi:hypothetical protein
MIEKIATRDEKGQVVRTLERELSPTEEAVVHCYGYIELMSRRQPQPDVTPNFVIDPAKMRGVDLDTLLELVSARATSDQALWTRSGWTCFHLRYGESGSQPALANATPKTVRHAGFI